MKRSQLLFVSLGVLALAMPGQGQNRGSTGPSDLAGTWIVYEHWDLPSVNDPGWDQGSFVVVDSGPVVGGSWKDSDGATDVVTGGLLTMEGDGVIAGTVDFASGDQTTFTDFRLDADKTVSLGVDTDLENYRTLTIAMLGGGAFTSSDLTGTWHYYGIWDDNSVNAPGWEQGLLAVDASGLITSGTLTDNNGGTRSLAGVSMVISAAGFVSLGGAPFTDYKMDAGKTIIGGAQTTAADRHLIVMAKGGGSFSTSDLEGTWHFYSFWDHPLFNDPGWENGTLIVQSDGSITGGSITDSDGFTDTVTGGSLSVDAAGLVAGTIDYALGGQGIVANFKLDAGKSMITGVGTDTDGYLGLAVALRPPTWVDMGFGLAGSTGFPLLQGSGTLDAGAPITLSLGNTQSSSPAALVIGLSVLQAPLKGGILFPNNDIIIDGLQTGPSGALQLVGALPPGFPPGLSIYFQYWIVDPGGLSGFAASNAISGTTP